jgi:hypothetical protein
VATAGAWAKQAWPKSDTATKAIEKEKRRRESKAVMVDFPKNAIGQKLKCTPVFIDFHPAKIWPSDSARFTGLG